MRSLRTIGYLLQLSIALFIPLVVLLYYYAEKRSETVSRRPVPRPAERPPEEEVGRTPDVPRPAPLPERALEIQGWIFDEHLAPLPGVVVRIVETGEEARTSERGDFRFGERSRPRRVTLQLEGPRGPLETFENVLAGDALLSEEDPEGLRPQVPEQPQRLRWTINLGPKKPVEESGAFWIAPGDTLIEEWDSGARVRVRGRTNLPDGLHVSAHMEFDGFRTIATMDAAKIEDGRWEAELVLPPAAHLFSGRYLLTVQFNQLLEDPQRMIALREEQRGRWDGVWEVKASRPVWVGDPGEARAEDREVEVYYRAALPEVLAFRDDLKLRVEELLRDGRGWDPRLLEGRARARLGWFHESFLTVDGGLDEARWRSYLDEKWRAPLKRILEEHRARTKRKYTEAESRFEGLILALLDISRVYSLLYVYPLFQLKPHPNDFYLDERGQQDLGFLENIVEENVYHLKRFLSLATEER